MSKIEHDFKSLEFKNSKSIHGLWILKLNEYLI